MADGNQLISPGKKNFVFADNRTAADGMNANFVFIALGAF